MDSKLENLAALVAEHRKTKKRGRYPEAIWAVVSRLGKAHSVEEISKVSGIHPAQISRRTNSKRPSPFREVELISAPAPIKPFSVELKRPDGMELRLRIEGGREEISGLIASFLGP